MPTKTGNWKKKNSGALEMTSSDREDRKIVSKMAALNSKENLKGQHAEIGRDVARLGGHDPNADLRK